MSHKKKTLLLAILDGWGHREDPNYNAIAAANTPNLDALKKEYPNMLISGSGLDVGLPQGQMGNSEVGHTCIGSGRVVYQDLTRIHKAIEDQTFQSNPVLMQTINQVLKQKGALHIMGLASSGGVHSHEDHIIAMINLAISSGVEKIYLHAFLDGRDTPPKSASKSLDNIENALRKAKYGKIVSLIGRYYAMDRDNNWERIEQAYSLISDGTCKQHFNLAQEALQSAYEAKETDEFVQARAIYTDQPIKLNNNDGLIFMNFRADRARQLTKVFTEKNFEHFKKSRSINLAAFTTLTEYASDIKAQCAFPPEKIINTLGEILQNTQRTQLRISETEKYAHVTFFFNGGLEEPFEGEDRILIPSPSVPTYDLKPEMSSAELTSELIHAIHSQKYDVIICNFPNGDMVGHTGKFKATIAACEAVDTCIGQIITALKETNGECLITADHGNAEQMKSLDSDTPHTAHTSELVPLLYIGRKATAKKEGTLADIAPTILSLIGEKIPLEMSGTPLFQLES